MSPAEASRWDEFVAGPLSPTNGGNAELQSLAAQSTHSYVDDATGDIAVKCAHFVVGGGITRDVALFPYQKEATEKLTRWFEDDRSSAPRTAMLSLPTGAGKTRTAVAFVRSVLLQHEGADRQRILWTAPTVELVEQAVNTVRAIWSDYAPSPQLECFVNTFPDVGALGKKKCNHMCFVTSQMASRRLEQIREYNACLLVFDEAHQAAARTYAQIVRAQISSDSGRAVGLSATPGRSVVEEGADLASLFSGPVITAEALGSDPIAFLRNSGVLAKLEFERIDLPEAWEGVRVTTLAKRSASLDALALNRYRFWGVVDAVAKLGSGRKSLVFGSSIAHCEAMEIALRQRDVRCATISYELSDADRRNRLKKFESGQLDVLLNKTILATGYDCGAITDVILATPIRSPILWEQIVGRACRGPAVGGTATATIWELDDHRRMHGQLQSYMRFLGDVWGS